MMIFNQEGRIAVAKAIVIGLVAAAAWAVLLGLVWVMWL
jgi:hypothetical protein